MQAIGVAQITPSQLSRMTWIATAVWIAVSCGSLFWHLWAENVAVVELARTEARASYEKDLLYRRWATLQGGVYVPRLRTRCRIRT